MSRTKFEVKQGNYFGVQGLNTDVEGFDQHVMKPEEVQTLFAENRQFLAQYVYPLIPSDGFDKPVLFSGEGDDKGGLNLKAEVVTNRKPKTCPGWFAAKVLPAEYIMKDHLTFVKHDEHGFGEGTLQITTVECKRPNGDDASFAKWLLAVENRPGLFLKISDDQGDFYPNVAVFFPAQATGWMHKSVEHGEAFVLVEQGTEMDEFLIENIKENFNKLVKPSYDKKGGLYNLSTHQLIAMEGLAPIVLGSI